MKGFAIICGIQGAILYFGLQAFPLEQQVALTVGLGILSLSGMKLLRFG